MLNTLRDLWTYMFTHTNLDEAEAVAEEAGGRDVERLYNAYQRGGRNRLRELMTQSAADFTGTELPAIETTATTSTPVKKTGRRKRKSPAK